MSLDIFASWLKPFSNRRKNKKSYGTSRRVLNLECLESRTVLSASVAAGVVSTTTTQHSLVAGGVAASVAVVNNTPVISKVVVSTAKHEITWNAAASDGISSSSISIDGVNQSTLYGPYQAAPGENYAWAWNSSGGTHTYVITAINSAGTSTQTSGTFTVPSGPTIGQVAVVMTPGTSPTANITWVDSSPRGVASSTLTFDGTQITGVYGPYTSASGSAYSAVIPLPAEGSHTYSITATDGTGVWSQYIKTIIVGPTISHVTVSTSKGQISWIASDPAGITSSSIVIEGVGTQSLYGPYTVSPGLAYSSMYGGLAQGTYNYTIIATDTVGETTQFNGTLTV